MAATRTVTIEYKLLEAVDVQHGEWCPHCALPSAAIVTLASQVAVDGVDQPLKLSTGVRCLEGHGWIRNNGSH